VSGTRFLDPKVLARISSLELLARTVVEGFINGLHRSPFFGLSTEFSEHREYLPGDDVRRIDWRVWGRTDRLYVKEFEADTNANFSVLLDVSRSMDFGSGGGLTKLDYGRYLAASLAYLSRRQRDRVGIVTFDRDLLDVVPPSAKHLDIVLHTLDRVRPGGPGELAGPLARITELLRRRSIAVLISDLYEEPEAVVGAVGPLRHRGSDVIVFHLLDPAERDFPFGEPAQFEDLESGLRIPVVPEALREEYRRVVAAHLETLAHRMADSRIDYCLVDTSRPLDFTLFEYLTRRQELFRVR